MRQAPRLPTTGKWRACLISEAEPQQLERIWHIGANVMTTLTREPATDGQMKQLTRMATDAAEKAVKAYADANYLSKEGAELVKGNADFVGRIHAATVLALVELSNTDKFKDEEVSSTYGYLSGYAPKGLTEQCNRLRELFSGIGFANLDLLTQIEKGDVPLPTGAEGWFAIPNWMKNPNIFGSIYSGALLKALDTIKQTRNGKFYNYRDGQLDEKRLRQSAQSQKFWTELADAQGNPDILIVPAQFGIRHRGRSVRRAREVFAGNEFGLGAFAVGIMILTHPERLMHYDDLWIDCAGDEFDNPDADDRFGHAPRFGFDDGKVKFGTGWADDADDYCGSASGVLPQ